MNPSNPTPSSLPNSTAGDTEPFLLRSRRSLRRTPPPLRTAARFFRRASSQRMMLRESSVRVRERAAAEVEERQGEWAYSKPVVALHVAWNLAFYTVSVGVLSVSRKEEPFVPLRVWILGYLLQGFVHSLCVVLEFRRRRRNNVLESSSFSSSGLESGSRWSFSSESDYDVASEQFSENHVNSIMNHIESANTILSFIWWLLGFYWVTVGGQSLTRDSPQLYWLCITFLAFDVVIVFICASVACLVGIAVCCCLPCILAILSAVADQEGATKEEIDQLPKYKFRMIKEFKIEGDTDTEESSRGVMTKCDSDSASEHVITLEDAECCICLSTYDEGIELRELPCNHHFHCACIDKWLLINATCPLCKFNILTTDNLHQEV